jgi:hypothetical protein
MDTAFVETSFSIGHQNCGNAGTSRTARNIELIQLGTLQKVKADRCTYCSGDPHTGRSRSKSFLSWHPRKQPNGSFRADIPVSATPAFGLTAARRGGGPVSTSTGRTSLTAIGKSKTPTRGPRQDHPERKIRCSI